MKRFRRTILAVAIFLLMQLAGGLLAAVMSRVLDMDTAKAISIGFIASSIITILLLFFLGSIRGKTFLPLHMKWSVVPVAIIAALLGIFAMDLLMEQLNMPDLMRAEFTAIANSSLGVIAIGIVGPITEELVFREGIISSLLRNNFHRWQAILISAAIFGIIHFNPVQIPFAFAIGIILGVIFTKTGNIILPSLIHIANNLLGVWEIRMNTDQSITLTRLIGGPIVAWICIIVCTVLCVICLRYFWRHHHRRHNNDHYSRK